MKKTMFIILLEYKKDLNSIDAQLAKHRAFLEEGYKKNYFIASGPQSPRHGGVIISQLKDRQLLEEIIQNDPFYEMDLADFKIIEFDPVKYHPDFKSFI